MTAPRQSLVDDLTAYLSTLNGRCQHGAHLATQGCLSCAPVAPDGDWAAFKAALRASVGVDGLIHQTDMRPRIASVFHKKRGRFYVRAMDEGLIEFVGKEPSTDAAGRNLDKDQKVYRWLGERAAVAA